MEIFSVEILSNALVGFLSMLIIAVIFLPFSISRRRRDLQRKKLKQEEAAKLKRAKTILPGDIIKIYKGIPIIKAENGCIAADNSFSNIIDAEKWISS